MQETTGIISHPYFKNFILYALMNLFVGICTTFFGVVIPYYEVIQHRDPSYYSTIIFSLSAGYFLGCLASNYIQPYLSFHRIVALGGTISMVSLIAFNFSSSLIVRVIFFFLTGVGTSFKNIYALKLCF